MWLDREKERFLPLFFALYRKILYLCENEYVLLMDYKEKLRLGKKLEGQIEKLEQNIMDSSGEFSAICLKRPEQATTTMGKSILLCYQKELRGIIIEFLEGKLRDKKDEIINTMK